MKNGVTGVTGVTAPKTKGSRVYSKVTPLTSLCYQQKKQLTLLWGLEKKKIFFCLSEKVYMVERFFCLTGPAAYAIVSPGQ